MKAKAFAFAAMAAILATGCSTARYEWGYYESALYAHYRNPTDLDSLAEKLVEVIARGEKEGKVPPGIYAEYGYVLLAGGKREDALANFEKEKRLWPESSRLMDTMIQMTKSGRQLKPPSPSPAKEESSKETRESGGRP